MPHCVNPSHDFNEDFSGSQTLHDSWEQRLKPVPKPVICGIPESYPDDSRRVIVQCDQGGKILVLRHDDIVVLARKVENVPIIQGQARLITDMDGFVILPAKPVRQAGWEIGIHQEFHAEGAGTILWFRYAAA